MKRDSQPPDEFDKRPIGTHQELPEPTTPEAKAEAAKITAQLRDPSTPLGAFFAGFITSEPHAQQLEVTTEDDSPFAP
jgi:hypothetical protein